jgi:hypothetical protein
MNPATDYTDPFSLELLKLKITSLSDRQKIFFSAFVMDKGLIQPRGFNAWLVWKIINRAAKLKKIDRKAFYIMLCEKSPHAFRMAIDTLDQTCAWLTDGKDATDSKSAGGFNADEIEQMDAIVDVVGMIS